MWIIQYLPSFATHLFVLLGIAGLLVTSIPFVWSLLPTAKAYKLVIQLISTALLCFGVYLEGGLAMQKVWEAQVADLKVKLANAETKSAKVNTVVVTEYVTKKEIIRQKGQKVTEYIDREVVKVNNVCTIPDQVIRAHNAAAINDATMLPTEEMNTAAKPPMKPTPAASTAPSASTDKPALKPALVPAK
jgi:hypothetical protein